MDITLRKITKENYEQIGELHLPDVQQNHLSENIWSMAEARFHETHHDRAIYRGKDSVGYLMWVDMTDVMTSIWRFTVAYEFQNQGIGRKALRLAIEEISSRQKLKEIGICYSPENTLAKALYFSVGFTEAGLSDCGTEAYALITLDE